MMGNKKLRMRPHNFTEEEYRGMEELRYDLICQYVTNNYDVYPRMSPEETQELLQLNLSVEKENKIAEKDLAELIGKESKAQKLFGDYTFVFQFPWHGRWPKGPAWQGFNLIKFNFDVMNYPFFQTTDYVLNAVIGYEEELGLDLEQYPNLFLKGRSAESIWDEHISQGFLHFSNHHRGEPRWYPLLSDIDTIGDLTPEQKEEAKKNARLNYDEVVDEISVRFGGMIKLYKARTGVMSITLNPNTEVTGLLGVLF